MPNIPPTALAIGALAILYIVIRVWASRAEERRRNAHDERMAMLFAEREAMEAGSPGGGTETDANGPTTAERLDRIGRPDPARAEPQAVKLRCRACKALSDETATTCSACGAEL